ETMSTHTGVPGGRVFAEAMGAEHVVLKLGDMAGGHARTNCGKAGLERLAIDVEGAQLRFRRLADDQRAAELRVIAVYTWCDLGRHHVAQLEPALTGRMHAHHLRSAGADDHEVVGAVVVPQERFQRRNDLILGNAGAADLPEYLISLVSENRGASRGFDLALELDGQQSYQHALRIGARWSERDSARHQRAGSGGKPALAQALQAIIDRCEYVVGEDDITIAGFGLCALRLYLVLNEQRHAVMRGEQCE